MGFGKQGTGQIIHDHIVNSGIGTLAQDTAAIVSSIAIGNTAGMDQPFRILKTEYHLSWDGKTAGEGPIIFGMSAGLTAAQLAEAVLSTPTDTSDKDEGSDANKPVWVLEVAQRTPTASKVDGRMKSFNPKWTVQHEQDLNWFAMNLDSALTTGTTFTVVAKHYGLFIKSP